MNGGHEQLRLAGVGIEPGSGRAAPSPLLDSGATRCKFLAIGEAQDGFIEPAMAPHARTVLAIGAGRIRCLHNRQADVCWFSTEPPSFGIDRFAIG